MPLNHQDNGVSMGRSLKEVSTPKKLLHFSEPKKQTKLVPFERVPGIMVVWMVMHIVKFVNGFPRKGRVKHFSPGENMKGWCLHANNLSLGFETYCQVAENVEPRNSLAPRTRAAYSLGNSGNLSGG